jgi:hypothetical protein
MVYRDGGEEAGVTSYSSCHKYTTKSVLRFDPTNFSSASTPPQRPEPPRTPCPFAQGLTFQCRIVTAIDSETSGGRLIEAVLQSPLRDDKGAILAPDGARIHGRLGHRSIHAYPGAFPDVGLRLDSVEVNGAQMPIYAVLVQRSQPPSGSASGIPFG